MKPTSKLAQAGIVVLMAVVTWFFTLALSGVIARFIWREKLINHDVLIFGPKEAALQLAVFAILYAWIAFRLHSYGYGWVMVLLLLANPVSIMLGQQIYWYSGLALAAVPGWATGALGTLIVMATDLFAGAVTGIAYVIRDRWVGPQAKAAL